MSNPFEKTRESIRHTKPRDESAERKNTEEGAINAERLQALRRFFTDQSTIEYLGHPLDKSFAPEDYMRQQTRFDMKAEGIEDTRMTEEEIRALVRSQIARYTDDLNWLQEQGYLELIDLGLYQLTSAGKGLVGPRQ